MGQLLVHVCRVAANLCHYRLYSTISYPEMQDNCFFTFLLPKCYILAQLWVSLRTCENAFTLHYRTILQISDLNLSLTWNPPYFTPYKFIMCFHFLPLPYNLSSNPQMCCTPYYYSLWLPTPGSSGKSAFANKLYIGLIRQNITNSTVVTLSDNLHGYHIK